MQTANCPITDFCQYSNWWTKLGERLLLFNAFRLFYNPYHAKIFCPENATCLCSMVAYIIAKI